MEIEAKLQVPDQRILEELSQVADVAGYPLSAPLRRTMIDTYMDTAEGLIAAAGYTCRKRSIRDRVVFTLKGVEQAGDEIHRREELETEVPGDTPWTEWPESPVRDMLMQIVGNEPLNDVLTLRQVRVVRRVGPPRRGIAELSLDRVEVERHQTAGEEQPPPAESPVFYEVEVELKPLGSEEQLADIAATLREQWGLTPQPLSKFARAWALVQSSVPDTAELQTASEPEALEPGAEKRKRPKSKRFLGDGLPVLEKPGLDALDTMAQAADKTLLYHLQQMMRHESGTRAGKDPEELHDMRVATRRMRAAVRVFGDYVEAGSLKPYLKMMRQTGRALGTVRDLDVFRIKVQSYIDSLPPTRRSELDPLLEAWECERERSRDVMVAFLDEDRYQVFKEKFESFLRSNGVAEKRRSSATGEPVPVLVRDVLPQIVFERLAEVRAYDEEMMSGTAPVIRFHQLRIAMKALRYTLEFFQEVLGPRVKPLIEITKQVQDHLGDLQDASVACEVVLNFLSSGTWGHVRGKAMPPVPVNAPGVAAYLTVKQKEIERLMRTFKPVWRRIRGPQFSRRLASLVGAL